jgi:type II secretion system GspH-like protein
MLGFHGQRGYTLFEMLGVMLVTTTLVAAGSSYLNDPSRVLDRSASQIAASLRLARSRAILTSRHTGVQFRPSANLYAVFEDVGLDGKGPFDVGYSGPDQGEGNDRHDFDAMSGTGEPASDEKNTVAEGIRFAILAEPDSIAPDGSGPIGSDPIPSETRALVFEPRGRLTEGTRSASCVYLCDASQTQMRAVCVDPWTGFVQIHKWYAESGRWSSR